MMKPFVAALIMLLVAGSGFAQEVKVRIDPAKPTVGRPFRIIVEARGNRIGELELPEIENVEVASQPSLTQTSINIVNFKRETVIVRGYDAIASEPGTYMIPAVNVSIDGKRYGSAPVILEVQAGSDSAESPVPSGNLDTAQSGRQEVSWSEVVLLEAEVDKRTVYVNEPIMLTLRLLRLNHRGLSVRSVDETPPSTEGFYVIDLEQVGSQGGSQTSRGDLPYIVEEHFKMLCPTTPGDLEIGPWSLVCLARVREGFRFSEEELHPSTDSIAITVNPLPDAPEAFTGAVGQFDVNASISRNDVIQGVPVTLEVEVRGSGNHNAVGAPIPPAIAWGSIGEPTSSVRSIPSGARPVFVKTFRYNITPTEIGKVEIPPFQFVYFDTEKERFVTQSLGPFPLSVQRASDQQRLIVDTGLDMAQEDQIDVVALDIRPIMDNPGDLTPPRSVPGAVPVAFATPVFAYVGLALYAARRRRFENDSGFARAHRAKRKARGRLDAVLASADPAQELYRGLTGYIADKCDVPQGGVTSAEAAELLRAYEVEEALIDNVVKILKNCERAAYASAQLSQSELEALVSGAVHCIERLDSSLKGGRRA